MTAQVFTLISPVQLIQIFAAQPDVIHINFKPECPPGSFLPTTIRQRHLKTHVLNDAPDCGYGALALMPKTHQR